MSVNFGVKLSVDTSRVRLYKPSTAEDTKEVKTLILRMNYGQSSIINADDAKVLEEVGVNVISVELIYTMFNKQDVQMRLNQKRIMELYFLAPNVFTQNLAKWKYIEQLGYKTEEDARKLFHGFVIKYHQVEVYKPATAAEMTRIVKEVPPVDTSCYKSLRSQVDFSDQLICVDMTGSMSPYYMQVLTWLNLVDSDLPVNFAFFNDGDMKPDYSKKAGDAGGIYMCRSHVIDTVVAKAYECVSHGYGGDCPENNIEAILKGVKKFPKTKEIIMIADNWAPMRDYAFIDEVKWPVHVILCGAGAGAYTMPLNPQYLDLARRTGGSISTMEQEITDLSKYKEGEELVIAGNKYVIRRGQLVLK